jgi:hypothetical protein
MQPAMSNVEFLKARLFRPFTLTLMMLCALNHGAAQDTPLLSGGVGFFTSTTGGKSTFMPIIEPLLAAPIGPRFLIESRAALLETWAPKGDGQSGYDHSHFIGLTYLQGDYFLTRHFTLVGGSFLLPFGTYNERLSPIWIGNLQDGPSASNIGLMSTGAGVGGMMRGSALSRPKYSIDYAAYFSAPSSYAQFSSKRSTGGRVDLYLPGTRLEVGFSYSRLLQEIHENFFGTHIWWEPKDTGLRIRSEFNRGQHAQGYWIETDYRLQKFGGPETWIGRFEPVFRMQQTFHLDTSSNGDGVSLVNTQRADFGLDYNLPHNTRILTSYSRRFSAAGDHNIWETGIVYRFLFPTWKGK